jgi:hypothetical protein
MHNMNEDLFSQRQSTKTLQKVKTLVRDSPVQSEPNPEVPIPPSGFRFCGLGSDFRFRTWFSDGPWALGLGLLV